MKKLVLIFILVICLTTSSTSFANSDEQFHYRWGGMGNKELTNEDLNNPKLYVFLSGLLLTSSPKDLQTDHLPLWELSYPEIPGFNYKDYDIVDSYPYNPNTFDFSAKNVWRLVSPSIKTQNDFDRIMYRPEGVETGQDFYFFNEGELRGGISYSLKKSQATLDLNKYMKLPGAEKALAEKYQWNEYNIEEFRNYFYGTIPGKEHYTDRHLFTYSIVIELEKKEVEEKVEEKDVKPKLEDTFGYAGVWKSSLDEGDYWTVIIEVSQKRKDNYIAALNYTGGTMGGIMSRGYIEFKNGKQYLSKDTEWMYYEGEPYPTFYIDLHDGKVDIITDISFSRTFGDRLTFDKQDIDSELWQDLEGLIEGIIEMQKESDMEYEEL